MLQKLDSEIRECYRHAAECSRRADESQDSLTKQDFLDAEKRWLCLPAAMNLRNGCRISPNLPEGENQESSQNELSNWPATVSAILINYANMPSRHWDFFPEWTFHRFTKRFAALDQGLRH